MRIEQLNLVIGLLVGVAIGLLLGKPKPDRNDNVRVLRRTG
jgi:hypothetical protein